MKKKILIRIGSLRHGGAEKTLVTFLKALPEDKYEIDLLLNLKSGKYLNQVPKWVNVLYLIKGEMITTNHPKVLPRKICNKLFENTLKMCPFLLYKFILKNKVYDIEFAAIHGFDQEILNSTNKNSKKLVWVHNDLSLSSLFPKERLKSFFKFDKILMISDKIKSDFEKLAGSEEDLKKLERIYNPIDTDEILNKANLPGEDFPFENKDIKTFITVGTIFPQKGFDRLLEAHVKLLKEGFLHQIMVVGDGYEMELLQQKINDKKVNASFKLLGFRDNPYPYFKMADYYVLSSRYEGYPTVLFEAMILKMPIIATDVSGVSEMLNGGKFGEIVENSTEGIFQGLRNFLLDENRPLTYQKEITNFNFPFTLLQSVTHLENILDTL